jgi:hypothetical protein
LLAGNISYRSFVWIGVPLYQNRTAAMKYIIIGGVAGGASTAARLRRMDEKASIVLFEK